MAPCRDLDARDRALVAPLAAAAVVGSLVSALWMWDFTIDDALISIRYAMHVARGVGYRFNADGPVTDGVTPLPWPLLLAPLAKSGSVLDVLDRAKALGLVSWVGAAGALGAAIARANARMYVKAMALAALVFNVPLAAHAVSGMETGVVLALTTLASLDRERPVRAAVLTGIASAFRPELVVWAVTLGAVKRSRGALAVAALPFVASAAIRFIAFGHVAPLAILAKPSDLAHGLAYAPAAAIVALSPILACAPIAIARARGHAAALGIAGVAHLGAIAFAGGDWMPYARLVAPIAPSLLYAFVLASPHTHAAATLARGVLALAAGVFMMIARAPEGRHVGRDRRALIEAARPMLSGAKRIASLDIGWVSAANESASIVDLAGLTDPVIAALPGGHTSKRVDPALLLDRDPDRILMRVASDFESLDRWEQSTFDYAVDVRLARSPLITEHYEARAFLPFGAKGAGYVVLTLRLGAL